MSHAQVYGPTLRRIEKLLKRLEWHADSREHFELCPECGAAPHGSNPGHNPGCELKAMIDQIQECA